MSVETKNLKELGAHLKAIRLEAGITQKQVSKRCNFTTPQFVSNIERGLVIPSPAYVKTIIKLTGVDGVKLIERICEVYKMRFIEAVNLRSKKQ